MHTHRVDRASRIMTAALTRRRALKGVAGAAALGLAGDLRRTRAATVEEGAPRRHDLPAAVLRPSDLPDGDRFGISRTLSYLGERGAIASQVVDERMQGALATALPSLVSGHYTAVTPLDGTRTESVTTKLFQFPSTGIARQAQDGLAAVYFAGTTEYPSDNERDRYYGWSTELDGVPVRSRAALSRAGEVVYIIFNVRPIVDSGLTPTPLPDGETAEMEGYRRLVALRLRDVLDPAYAGFAWTIPTVSEFGAATRDGSTFGITAWSESYLQYAGLPVRHHTQTDARYQEFITRHPDLTAAYYRIEAPSTFNGNSLIFRQEGYRFGTGAGAEDYFNQLLDRLLENAASEEGFAVQPIDPPPDTPRDVPSQYFVEDYGDGDEQTRGVSGWFRNGTDVHRLYVTAPLRTPEQNADPAYVAALTSFAGMGAELIDIIRQQGQNDRELLKLYTITPGRIARIEALCSTIDELLDETENARVMPTSNG
jgi:hypothetical protein